MPSLPLLVMIVAVDLPHPVPALVPSANQRVDIMPVPQMAAQLISLTTTTNPSSSLRRRRMMLKKALSNWQ
jgi:hypothetical protein